MLIVVTVVGVVVVAVFGGEDPAVGVDVAGGGPGPGGRKEDAVCAKVGEEGGGEGDEAGFRREGAVSGGGLGRAIDGG